jgi:uncharacterized protein (UPF0276 family)
MLFENPSSYIDFAGADMTEWQFLDEMTRRTGCGLLLDVNNVFVSCFNTGADPVAYLEAFPCERVVQMHLAGHQQHGSHIIDTHDRPVRAEVWELFRLAWARTAGASTLLEWDGDIPSFADCHAELLKAERYMDGRFEPERAQPAEPSGGGVSNPVGFLVPRVMDSAVMEPA